jgi:hypothetical protein
MAPGLPDSHQTIPSRTDRQVGSVFQPSIIFDRHCDSVHFHEKGTGKGYIDTSIIVTSPSVPFLFPGKGLSSPLSGTAGRLIDALGDARAVR